MVQRRGVGMDEDGLLLGRAGNSDGNAGDDAPEQMGDVVPARRRTRVMGWSKSLSRWTARPAAEMDAAALALVADAQAAARLRGYQNDHNVAALSIERTRDRLDRFGWLFLFAGLAYTTVNVQAFVANGAAFPDLRWLTAWLVEPMVMGLMLVLLRGEQIANRYGETSGRWVKITRWGALLITYVMNTSLYYATGDPKEIFIHSVPVVLVFLAAEALVQQRLTLTTVVEKLGAPSQRRGRDLESLSVAQLLAPPRPGPQTPPEAPNQEGQAPNPTDELAEPRTNKERAYAAFCDLVAEGRGLDDIGPAEVDRRAGVRVGTSKVPGYMAEFRARWVTEQDRGEGDGEATG